MATYTLDGSHIHTQTHFQEYLAVVKPDREGFGCNLDAFNDALWGGPGYPGDDSIFRILNSKQMTQSLGEHFVSVLREICEDKGRAKLELL